MDFSNGRNRALKALLLSALIFSAQFAPYSYASVPADCPEKNYQPNIVPQHMGVKEKKHRFRCLVESDIEAVYSELNAQYAAALIAVKQNNDNEKLKRMRLKYGVESNLELLIAIKPHPRSIAIAQAAIESAWGTSRIFTEANNIFGIRPFSRDDPRISANRKRGNKTVWLRKYASIRESIADYYLVLGRASAYRGFRSLKMKTADPYKMITGLVGYSERKAGYVRELSSIIRYNKFHELD